MAKSFSRCSILSQPNLWHFQMNEEHERGKAWLNLFDKYNPNFLQILILTTSSLGRFGDNIMTNFDSICLSYAKCIGVREPFGDVRWPLPSKTFPSFYNSNPRNKFGRGVPRKKYTSSGGIYSCPRIVRFYTFNTWEHTKTILKMQKINHVYFISICEKIAQSDYFIILI